MVIRRCHIPVDRTKNNFFSFEDVVFYWLIAIIKTAEIFKNNIMRKNGKFFPNNSENYEEKWKIFSKYFLLS